MNAVELKKSVLNYAFQGRLTKTSTLNDSAKHTLEKIMQEQITLIKEKKIKKENSIDSTNYSDIPFDIPDHWVWVKHNQIFEIIGGSQPPKSYFKSEPSPNYVRLYQIRDYGNSPVPVYVPKNKVTKFTNDGDILLARYGASVGKVFIAKQGAYNVAMAKIKKLFQSEHLIDNLYLYYYYCSSIYQSKVRNFSRSAQSGFNKNDLNSLWFPLPPLEEQKRIIDKIEELFFKIDSYDNHYLALEALNKRFPKDLEKSILQYAMAGKLVEQDTSDEPASELLKRISEQKEQMVKEKIIKKEKALPPIIEEEIPFDIPETWEWVKLGEICVTNIGVTYKPESITTKENPNSIPVLRSSNIQNSLIDLNDLVYVNSEVRNNQFLHPGDILMCVRNGSPKLVGKTAIVNCSGMAFGAFMSKVSSPINEYLQIFFQSNVFKDQLVSSKTTTINQITQSVLKNILVPIPPLEEQKRIVFATNNVLNKFKEKFKHVF
ncbi:restriction endonuclease subunit S [Exiguobacterium sp. s146]|uniref:restriction endonuclease subunit S n=1 Tax=Exiguobacterium sp. s146 TaxID=2751223 RepID=UPI001BE743E6|nr:restriction endonuclease subunit S [Exiguobacterium sp. s146]